MPKSKTLIFKSLADGTEFVLCAEFIIHLMKTIRLKKSLIILLPALLTTLVMHAQVASWSFNGTLSGTGSANAVAGNASLGSLIPTGAYNAATVYYGEDGWPFAGIDMDGYREFSITPTAGHL